MRKKKAIYNSLAAFISNIINIVISFISRSFFIKLLGIEYLGINGLFSNVISMLSIAELGIGSAIIFNLYKPIANDNKREISALMNFYKKAYSYISIIVLAIGLILVPFLPLIVGETTININLTITYLIFLVEILVSYFLSYKRSLLFATQNNYIVNTIHIGYIIVLNSIQILFLYLTKNYYIHILLRVLMQLIENIIINTIINRKYPYLREYRKEKISKNVEKDIFKKVKALFLHKIGGFLVLGTDNIIISAFINIKTVGLYANYTLIINNLNNLFKQFILAVTPSVGNLLVNNNKESSYSIFNKIRFLNTYISIFVGCMLIGLLNPFITIWLGKEYLFSISVIIVLVINYYLLSNRNTYNVFKDAAGIFFEDRFVPLIESLLNIIFSIILVKKIGLIGVFIGTFISSLALWCYSYPKYVYKKIFDRSYKNYIKETLGYFILYIVILMIQLKLLNLVSINSIYLNFGYSFIVSFLLPNIVMILLFRKSDNFKYYFKILKNIFNKIFNRQKN